jgi:hypothetical protein
MCVQRSQGGRTALLLACELGCLELAQWLVANAGSDPTKERDSVRAVHASESF